MVTAVSTANTYSAILNELLGAQNKEITAQQQVSTGKKGDDLSAFGGQTRSLVATNTVKARTDTLVSQLNNLTVKLNFQQTALSQVSTVAGNVQQALTQALADGSGDSVMADLQTYFSQAAEALNSQYDGDYIFSGGQTQTQPFTAASMADLTSQPSVSSFFQNGSLAPTSSIDDNTTIQTGFLASDVGSQLMGVFQNIQTFANGPNGGFSGPLTDAQQAFLTSTISSLQSVTQAATQTTAQGGNIQDQVAQAVTSQTDRKTTLTNMLGDITDVNTAQAAADLAQAQTAVQASAQVFQTLKGMSLLDYLTATTTG